jgi:hypothetical protein
MGSSPHRGGGATRISSYQRSGSERGPAPLRPDLGPGVEEPEPQDSPQRLLLRPFRLTCGPRPPRLVSSVVVRAESIAPINLGAVGLQVETKYQC